MCSSRKSRPKLFDKNRVLNNFAGKYLSRDVFFLIRLQAEDLTRWHRSFLQEFLKHLLTWIGWYFLLVGWHFFEAVVVVGAAISNSCKVFVNPTGQTESCFHVADFHIWECLFTFGLNMIVWSFFFMRIRKERWKCSAFFSLIFISAVIQISWLDMLSSKSLLCNHVNRIWFLLG